MYIHTSRARADGQRAWDAKSLAAEGCCALPSACCKHGLAWPPRLDPRCGAPLASHASYKKPAHPPWHRGWALSSMHGPSHAAGFDASELQAYCKRAVGTSSAATLVAIWSAILETYCTDPGAAPWASAASVPLRGLWLPPKLRPSPPSTASAHRRSRLHHLTYVE
jgi:hypothetical protein